MSETALDIISNEGLNEECLAEEVSIEVEEEAEVEVEESEEEDEESDEDMTEELPPDVDDVQEKEVVKEIFPESQDLFFGETLLKDDPRIMLVQEYAAMEDQLEQPISLSQHSEDSSSSKEDSKKDGEAQEDTNFTELEERKYHEIINNEKKGKIKAETDLLHKSQKMVKDLECTNELRAQVKSFKGELEKKENEINNLKAELDESYRRQQDLTDEKKSLFKKIEQLDRDLDKRQLEDQIKESGADVKGKTRESYIKEIGRLKRELDILEGRLLQSQNDREALEKKLQSKEKECTNLEEQAKIEKYEVMKQEQKKKVVEKDLERALVGMTELKRSVGRHYDTFKRAVMELTHLDTQNYELKKGVSGLKEQNKIMSKYIEHLRDRLDYVSKVFFKLKEENSKLKNLCSNQTGSLELIQKKSVDVEKYIERWSNRLAFVEKKRKAALQEVKNLSHDLMLKRKEGKHTEVVVMKLNKRIHELQYDKTVFSQQIKKISDLLKIQKETAQAHMKVIEELTDESEKLKLEAQNCEKKVEEWKQLKSGEEKEKKIFMHQNELLTAELQICVHELRSLKTELNKKDKDIKTVLDDYNNLLAERRELQQKLLQIKGTSKDYEFKLNHLYSEINHYRGTIGIKDDLNEKMINRVKRLETDYAQLNDKFKHGKLDIRSLNDKISEKEHEKSILNDLIRKGETMRLALMRDVDRLRQDITILRTTIQRRNAEIALRDEKVELINVVMKNGENEYKQRLADIGLLKTEVSKLRAEKRMLAKAIENNTNLKKELFYLQKELTQEKQKSHALEEQMESPINVHRWRILEGRDPEKNELIQKTQLLQKKLFQSEEKYSTLEEKLKALQVMHNNLKDYLAKLPGGPECAQNLQEAKRLLRRKTTENQRLAAEAAAYCSEYRQMKKKMEESKKEAVDTMKKYYELKNKIDYESRRKSQTPAEQMKQPLNQSPIKVSM